MYQEDAEIIQRADSMVGDLMGQAHLGTSRIWTFSRSQQLDKGLRSHTALFHIFDQITFIDSLRALWQDGAPTLPASWLEPAPRTRTVMEDVLEVEEFRNMTHNALRERLSMLTCISILPDEHFWRRHRDWDCLQADIFLANVSSNEIHSPDVSSEIAQQQCLELLRYYGDECHFDIILQRMFIGCAGCRMLSKPKIYYPAGFQPFMSPPIEFAVAYEKFQNSDQSISPRYREDPVTITRPALLLCIKGSRPWIPHGSLRNSTSKRPYDVDVARLRIAAQPHLLALLAAWRARQSAGRIRHLPPWVCLFGIVYDSTIVHFFSFFPFLAESAAPASDFNTQWQYHCRLMDSIPVLITTSDHHQHQTAAQLRLRLALACWSIQRHLFRLTSLFDEVRWPSLVQNADLHRDVLTRGYASPRRSFPDPNDEELQASPSLRELRRVAMSKVNDWRRRTTTFRRASKRIELYRKYYVKTDPLATNTDKFDILTTSEVPPSPWIETNAALKTPGCGNLRPRSLNESLRKWLQSLRIPDGLPMPYELAEGFDMFPRLERSSPDHEDARWPWWFNGPRSDSTLFIQTHGNDDAVVSCNDSLGYPLTYELASHVLMLRDYFQVTPQLILPDDWRWPRPLRDLPARSQGTDSSAAPEHSFELCSTKKWSVEPVFYPDDCDTNPCKPILPSTVASENPTVNATLIYRNRESSDIIGHNEMHIWLYWFEDSEWHWQPRADFVTLNRLAPNILFDQMSSSLNETPFSSSAEDKDAGIRASKLPSPQLSIARILSLPFPCMEQDSAPWNSIAIFSMLVSRFVRIERGSHTNLVTDFGHEPIPDIALRLRCQSFDRPPKLCPLLVAGWDMTSVFPSGDDAGPLAQMLRSSLVFLILHYLDQRKTKNQPLPWWLALFAISYTATTVRVYALFPRTWEDSVTREIRWSFTVSLLSPFNPDDPYFEPLHTAFRRGLITILLRIREHISVLSEHLVKWEGPALDKLESFVLTKPVKHKRQG